jgi:hypothetical protein
MTILPMCTFCRHQTPKGENPEGVYGATCSAFPRGIPRAIFFEGADHRKPYPGDQGIRFEPENEMGARYVAGYDKVPEPTPPTREYPPGWKELVDRIKGTLNEERD